MPKICKLILRLAAVPSIALVPAGAALADPPDALVDVASHRHFLVTPNGDRVPIGPDICADPDLQDAFNQFHFNVHTSGAIETLGPQRRRAGAARRLGRRNHRFGRLRLTHSSGQRPASEVMRSALRNPAGCWHDYNVGRNPDPKRCHGIVRNGVVTGWSGCSSDSLEAACPISSDAMASLNVRK